MKLYVKLNLVQSSILFLILIFFVLGMSHIYKEYKRFTENLIKKVFMNTRQNMIKKNASVYFALAENELKRKALSVKEIFNKLKDLNRSQGQIMLLNLKGEFINKKDINKKLLTTALKNHGMVRKLNTSIIDGKKQFFVNNYRFLNTSKKKNISPIYIQFKILEKHDLVLAFGCVMNDYNKEISLYNSQLSGQGNWLIQQGVLSFLFGIILVFILSVFLIKNILTDPINKMVYKIQRVQEGEFETKVPFINRNDEIGDLARNFKYMLDTLRLNFKKLKNEVLKKHMAGQALKELNQNLELTVQERTAKLEEEKNRVQQSEKLKTEFLANISHEFRTPLNAILGFSELLGSQINKKIHKKYLESIKNAGSALLNLISDILDLSKLESGNMELNKAWVNIDRLFFEVKSIFVNSCREKGIQLRLLGTEKIKSEFYLDETRLRQILINLIGNAIKFTDKGEVKLVLKVKELKNNFVSLSFFIEDTGIGIPESEQKNIFLPFHQYYNDAADSKSYDGTGLGLTITQRLVKMMQGEIILESSPGEGSIFHIFLPKVSSKIYDMQGVQSDDGWMKVEFAAQRVLVVDDIQSNRQLLKDLLKYLSLEVIEASNGEEAIQKVLSEKVDIILMDIRMPKMDGYETLKHLKKYPEYHHVPVIAVTASPSESDLNHESAQFDAFLIKPIQIEKLIEHFCNFLPYKFNGKSFGAGDSYQREVESSEMNFLVDYQDEFLDILKGSFNMERLKEIQETLLKKVGPSEDSTLRELLMQLKAAIKEFDISQIYGIIRNLVKQE